MLHKPSARLFAFLLYRKRIDSNRSEFYWTIHNIFFFCLNGDGTCCKQRLRLSNAIAFNWSRHEGKVSVQCIIRITHSMNAPWCAGKFVGNDERTVSKKCSWHFEQRKLLPNDIADSVKSVIKSILSFFMFQPKVNCVMSGRWTWKLQPPSWISRNPWSMIHERSKLFMIALKCRGSKKRWKNNCYCLFLVVWATWMFPIVVQHKNLERQSRMELKLIAVRDLSRET